MVATLVFGLEDSSRVKRHFSGQKLTLEQLLMAMAVDSLRFIAWSKTVDAKKKRNRPKSITERLLNTQAKEKDDLLVFNSPEDFDQFIKEKRNGQQ